MHSGGTSGWKAPEVESGELVCQSCGFTHIEGDYNCNLFLFSLSGCVSYNNNVRYNVTKQWKKSKDIFF